ncbi:MAG: hypothetical protein R2724_30710 [Bryobacterales bacterium]
MSALLPARSAYHRNHQHWSTSFSPTFPRLALAPRNGTTWSRRSPVPWATPATSTEAYLLDVLHQTEVEVDRSLGGLPLDLRGQVHSNA